MLTGEDVIQQALNAAGTLASRVLLQQFDTDGSAIQAGSTRLTTKGQVLKPTFRTKKLNFKDYDFSQ